MTHDNHKTTAYAFGTDWKEAEEYRAKTGADDEGGPIITIIAGSVALSIAVAVFVIAAVFL